MNFWNRVSIARDYCEEYHPRSFKFLKKIPVILVGLILVLALAGSHASAIEAYSDSFNSNTQIKNLISMVPDNSYYVCCQTGEFEFEIYYSPKMSDFVVDKFSCRSNNTFRYRCYRDATRYYRYVFDGKKDLNLSFNSYVVSSNIPTVPLSVHDKSDSIAHTAYDNLRVTCFLLVFCCTFMLLYFFLRGNIK